jgi:type I restriction enzyme S subunit
MSEHIIRIVPNPAKLDPCYLLAFLRSRCGQEQLARGVFGSVIDEITPEFVGDLEIPLPKSKKMVQVIADNIRAGEESRNGGIERFSVAIKSLEQILET